MNQPRVIFLAILIVAGAFISANLVTPIIYRSLPSDFDRTKLILDALRNPIAIGSKVPEPEIVLFGNSILMSGIDAHTLTANLQETPLAYNLSSNGQSLLESLLYYEILPTNVKTVVQFVRAEQMTRTVDSLSDETARNFYMFGYRPGQLTHDLYSSEGLSYFGKPWWTINYEARVIVPNSIDRGMRGVLRPDLDLSAVSKELYFPNVYKNKLNEQQYVKMITRYNPREAIETFIPNEETMMLLRHASEGLAKRNIRLVIAIHPINPKLSNYTEKYRRTIARFVASHENDSMHFIDCSGILEETDFVDHWHVSRAGAVKLTKEFANKLRN